MIEISMVCEDAGGGPTPPVALTPRRPGAWIIEVPGLAEAAAARVAHLSDVSFRSVPQATFRRVTIAATTDRGALVQRPLILAGVGAALLALYSCSMQASVSTDPEGRIVELSSLRIESSLSRWAVELLVIGGQIAFELRRTPPAEGAMRKLTDCPMEEAPGAVSAGQVA
jgi:hypothetical protein